MATTISPESLVNSRKPKVRRGTYYVQTWGCQMNEEDSEQLALRLRSIGFTPADSILDAHVILLNTCSVRKKPEDKAFSLLGELAMLKERRPEIIIGVCGCMAQLRCDEIKRRAPHVDFVIGTGQIESVPSLVEEAAQTRRFQARLDLPDRRGAVVADVPKRLIGSNVECRMTNDELATEGGVGGSGSRVAGMEQIDKNSGKPLAARQSPISRAIRHSTFDIQLPQPPTIEAKPSAQNPNTRHQTRNTTHPKLKAFVPIQYGCDKFCTFCIVPTTRGRERSRPTEDIVAEVLALAALGTREVTLLGQTVNSYGKNLAEGRVPFSKLLWLLGGIPGLSRIRYTSPYPRDFKEDLIACIRDNHKVMEHVHLPLQSGDDVVLRSMKRVYTVQGFLDIAAALRTAIPSLSLTTDVIVGFPGETDEKFQRTLDLIRQVRFDGAFMFAYSPRPGTPAADMEQVPAAVKRERLHALVELQTGITVEKNAGWVGRTMEVLVEGPSPKNPKRLQGYSREFKMVHFEGPSELRGELVQVEAMEPHLWGLIGKLT